MATRPQRGKWAVERKPAIEQWVYTNPAEIDQLSYVYRDDDDFEDLEDEASTIRGRKVQSTSPSKYRYISPPPPRRKPNFFHYLFFCCISTRPRYTKIQHLVIPTSQVCIGRRALKFLQIVDFEDFCRLQTIVHEVFMEDGVKALGRTGENDELIEAALRGQIRMKPMPWRSDTRESYVEHVAGLYARLLRKLATYDRCPITQKQYQKKWGKQSKHQKKET